jgi:hypothetical protein
VLEEDRMSEDTEKLQFYHEGIVVGYFEEEEYPRAPGRYRYMAFRSSGHFRMQTALQAGLQPRCTFRTGDRICSFKVVRYLEPDTLMLQEFRYEKAT